ncbi:hypothetical protein QTP86_022743, partial [Hemibagrus guttatus]
WFVSKRVRVDWRALHALLRRGSDLMMARPPPDPVFTLRGSAAPVNTLHFHCAEAGLPLLYSGSGKGLVHVWKPEHPTSREHFRRPCWSFCHLAQHCSLHKHLAQVFPFFFVCIFSHGRDMQVCMWDLHEGRRTVTHSLHTGSVGFCQCSLLEGDGSKTLIALPAEKMEEIKVTELESRTLACSLIPDDKHGMLMCMKMWKTDAGPLLCAGYEDGSLVIWDVSYSRPVSCLKVHPEPVMCLDFDVSRQKGISGSSDKNLCSWILDGQQNLQIQDSVPLTNPGVSHLHIRGDGKIVAAGGWDGNVRIFSWKKMKPLAVLQHHKDLVHSVAFSDHPEPSKRLMAGRFKGSAHQPLVYLHRELN